MSLKMKVATWNICLGMKNKKDYIYQVMKEKEIDICLLQEVELEKDYDVNLLTDKEYRVEVETNNIKSRTAILIKDNIEYVRQSVLEDVNSGIVIIDVLGIMQYRVINIYRSFNPPNNISAKQFFEKQIDLLRTAITSIGNKKLIFRGDFNLDDLKRHAIAYRHKSLFEPLIKMCDDHNLIQMLDDATWQ